MKNPFDREGVKQNTVNIVAKTATNSAKVNFEVGTPFSEMRKKLSDVLGLDKDSTLVKDGKAIDPLDESTLFLEKDDTAADVYYVPKYSPENG